MSRSTVWTMALIACAAPAWGRAESRAEVWQGEVGKLPVVVELSGEHTLDGQYFYRKHLRDLELRGVRDGSGVHLQVRDRDDRITERWELRERGDALEGQWRAGQRSLPVRLQRVDLAALRAGKNGERYDRAGAQAGAYDALRLSELSLQPGRSEDFQGHRLQWWREPRSGMDLFTVESGYDQATRSRLNRILRQRLWRSALDALQCRSAENSDFEQSVTPRLLDRRFLSVSLMSSYYCGGAHPDFGDSPLNLDVRDGRELTLQDVLWLGQGKPPAADAQRRDYDDPEYQRLRDYRDHTLAPWIVATLGQLRPQDMTAPAKPDEGCDYRDTQVWNLPIWHLRPEGLYVGPYFARVARACEYPEWSVIPWPQVERHPGAALKAK